MLKYAIATDINGLEEYMHQQHGDDCYTDDIGHAILFNFAKNVPLNEPHEYIVEVENDQEGGMYVIGKYVG